MVHCTWDVLELDAFSSFFKGWRPFFPIHSYWKGQLSFSLSSKSVPSNFDLIIFITSYIFHLPVAVMLTFFHTLQAFNKPQPGKYNIFIYHCALWSCFILGSQLWLYSFRCCLMSLDVGWHIRDKLRPVREHGSILLYIHGNQKARYDGRPRIATSTLTQLRKYGGFLL